MIAPATRSGNHDTDAALMMRAANDDFEAFVELYGKHREPIIHYITRSIGNNSQSEDLAQQVFLRVFRSRKGYTPSAKFTTWLYTITRNVISNAGRDLSLRRDRLPGCTVQSACELLDGVPCSTHAEPSESVVQSEIRSMVGDAIGKLAKRQQQAIQLVYIHGHSYQAAAAKMGVTAGSVKLLLVRGKENLRRMLIPSRVEGELIPNRRIARNYL